jgi:Ca2+-binding RTX toxin-like protein
MTKLGGDGEPGEDDDIANDVENVSGGSGGDRLTGDGLANILDAGPGNDVVNGGGGFDLVHGNDGSDNLNGGTGTDQLFGDAGNDTLFGAGDADTLHGGNGDDSLDGGTGADVLNGDGGKDTANYSTRSNAVTLTLDGAPNDGQSRENDLIKIDVENVSSGAGNDKINSVDGVAGRISCGRGTDTVTADAKDTVAADCELKNVAKLSRCSITRRSATMSRKGVVGIRINCAASGKGTLTLRKGRAKIGKKRFSVRSGRVKTVKVKLTKKGRRAVKRAKHHRLRIKATLSSVRKGKVRAARGTTRTVTIKASGRKRKR